MKSSVKHCKLAAIKLMDGKLTVDLARYNRCFIHFNVYPKKALNGQTA
ncbi:MAG: hypothetical protein N3E44_03630 [Candidatus Bathyarchaeota archaeon]|nr:hypothetical protein [Candidatus Bathyarchaeota archaeon]